MIPHIRTAAWRAAETWIPAAEGGEVNDPNDPGGHTKYGICKRDHPKVDIARLTLDAALDIYWNEYWTPIDGTRIETHLGPAAALILLDTAILQGVDRAKKILQKRIGVTADGKVGPNTRAALERVRTYDEKRVFARDAVLDRYDHLDDLKNAYRYLPGWSHRLQNLRGVVEVLEAR